MTIETLICDWLKAQIVAAEPTSPLYGAEALPSSYEKLAKVRSIQIGPAESKFAPVEDAMEEFDGKLFLLFYVKVSNRNDMTTYDDALVAVTEMAKEVARLMWLDPNLDERLRDSLWDKFVRTITQVDNHPHALGNLPLLLNQTGQAVGS